MERDSEYFVNNSKQIFNHLNQLLKQNSLLSVHFGDHDESFITAIVGLDRKKNLIQFDSGPKKYLNKQLLKSGDIEFRTELQGIKIAFPGQKLSPAHHHGQLIFVMPIPPTIFWLQRRYFYRVKVPLSHSSYCKITLQNENKESQQTVKLKLIDISISGISLLNDQPNISNELIPTTLLESCELHLDNSTWINMSLTIKDKNNLFAGKPEKGQRIGCIFNHMTLACESNIQRYMRKIERELKKMGQ